MRRVVLAALAMMSVLVPAYVLESSGGVSAVSVSATHTERGRTRKVTFSSDVTSSGNCLRCLTVWYKFNNGNARLANSAVSSTKIAITKSRVTPKARASGIALSASVSSAGAVVVGASSSGGACDAGTYEANGSIVSVRLNGTWCKISSNFTLYNPRISVTGATLYTSAWSTVTAG